MGDPHQVDGGGQGSANGGGAGRGFARVYILDLMSGKAPSTHPVDLFEPIQSAPRLGGHGDAARPRGSDGVCSRSAVVVRVLVALGRVSRPRSSWRFGREAESLEDGVRHGGFGDSLDDSEAAEALGAYRDVHRERSA
jgi:hypothetical protein